MSNVLGVLNTNSFVPYTASSKRTKWLSLPVSGTNYSSTTRSYGMFYADSNGVWHLRYNARLISSSVTSWTPAIGDSTIVFKNTANYYANGAGCVGDTAQNAMMPLALPNTNTLSLGYGSSQTTWAVWGDWELESEPTTYTTSANMEGVVQADVYIPPASAGVQGLVNNTSGNTLGTPIKGKTDGVAVAAGYVGEVKTADLQEAGTESPAINTYYDDAGTLELTKGSWLIILSTSGYGVNPGSISGSVLPTVKIALRQGSSVLAENAVCSGVVNGVDMVGSITLTKTVDIDSTTTYKCSVKWVANSGSPTLAAVYSGGSATDQFYAIRLA